MTLALTQAARASWLEILNPNGYSTLFFLSVRELDLRYRRTWLIDTVHEGVMSLPDYKPVATFLTIADFEIFL